MLENAVQVASDKANMAASTPQLNDVLGLFQNFATIGGALWLVWGAVTLAGGLKDQNGPQLQSGIWQCLGGGLIIAAAVLFGQISA